MDSARNGRIGAAMFGLLLVCRQAPAANCAPATLESTCFDADELWIPPTPSRFIGMAPTRVLENRHWVLGLDTTYLDRPIALNAASPDPYGRTIPVADQLVDTTLSGGWSPVEHLELTAAVPFYWYRSGTGLSGVTSQNGPGLSSLAMRDVRLGAAHDLIAVPEAAWGGPSAASRLEVALPTGAAGSFGGTGTLTVAPSIALGERLDFVFLSTEQGARFSRVTNFGGSVLGAQFVSKFGASVAVAEKGLFSIAAEVWFLPALFLQTRSLQDGSVVTNSLQIPAEWMVSARSRIGDVFVQLGGGTAVPVSYQKERGVEGTEVSSGFAGVTAPAFRASLVIRYAPDPDGAPAATAMPGY